MTSVTQRKNGSKPSSPASTLVDIEEIDVPKYIVPDLTVKDMLGAIPYVSLD